MKPRVFFHHIHKTAGTSLHAAFVALYGAEAVSPRTQGLSVPQALRTYADKNVVAGHMVAVPGHPVPAGFYSLTVLRDPIERFISHLFFTLEEMGIALPQTADSSAWWAEILDRVEGGAISARNWQVESLCRYGLQTDTHDGAGKLQAAIDALAQFSLVGVTSSLDDVLSVMAIDCGWNGSASLPTLNVTPNRPHARQLSAAVVDRIRAMNALDMDLYARAESLFAASRTRALRSAAQATQGGASQVSTPDTTRPREEAAVVRLGSGEVTFVDGGMHAAGVDTRALPSGEMATLWLELLWQADCPDVTVGIRVRDSESRIVFGSNSHLLGYRAAGRAGDRLLAEWRLVCDVAPGRYFVDAALHPFTSHDARCYDYREPMLGFEVTDPEAETFGGAFNLRPTLDLTVKHASATGSCVIERVEATSHMPLSDFRAAVDASAAPGRLASGASTCVPITVANLGKQAWQHRMPRGVNVSYHIRDAEGREVVFDGERSPLPKDLPPRESATVQAKVVAPRAAGRYVLHWTLVQEGVAWFSERDPKSAAEVELVVEAA